MLLDQTPEWPLRKYVCVFCSIYVPPTHHYKPYKLPADFLKLPDICINRTKIPSSDLCKKNQYQVFIYQFIRQTADNA
jgi:hypothetical protein